MKILEVHKIDIQKKQNRNTQHVKSRKEGIL
jgi:hypothetical protein